MELDPKLVRPRVGGGGPGFPDNALLTDWLDDRIARRTTGLVHLVGPPGSGRRTALAVARAHVAPHADRVHVVDDESDEARDEARLGELELRAREVLVLRVEEAWPTPSDAPGGRLELVPWSRDEIVEYLLTAHRARVGELLARFESATAVVDPHGHAGTVRAVLDAFARDAALVSVHEVIERQLARIDTTRAWPPVRDFHLAREFLDGDAQDPRSVRARDLAADVLQIAAALARLDGRVPERLLQRSLASGFKHALALVGVANRADPGALRRWIAERWGRCGQLPPFDRHDLAGVVLRGAWLRGWSAERADLSGARLTWADLSHARLGSTCLAAADLAGAELSEADLMQGDGTRACFDDVRAVRVSFERAVLTGATFVRSVLTKAYFRDADLRSAVFQDADLTGANLRADLRGTAFVNCTLERARLGGVDLRPAHVASRRFRGADLERANLEGISIEDVDLSQACLVRARLGHSVLPRARFVDADLSNASLADVSWVGADLTGADLTGAVFRAGTTRSGLLLGAPAMEGARTGFYTPEDRDLLHLDPEVVRSADLRNTIWSDAKVDGSDFRLVDLRGAVCSPDQREHFRKCGAILDP